MIKKLCTILLLAAFVAPAWAQQTRGDKEGVVFAPRKGQWQVSLVLGNSGQSYNDNTLFLLPQYTNTEGSIGLPSRRFRYIGRTEWLSEHQRAQ